jgi:hypothetical protein
MKHNLSLLDDVTRMKILRIYIKRQLSRGLEIQGIDVQEIAEWPIDIVLKYFPYEEKEES